VPEGASYQVKDNIFIIQPGVEATTFVLEAALQFRIFSVTVYFK